MLESYFWYQVDYTNICRFCSKMG